jgi:hypothetical protein
MESLYHTALHMLDSGYHIPKDVCSTLMSSLGQSLPKYENNNAEDANATSLVDMAKQEIYGKVCACHWRACKCTQTLRFYIF